MMPEIESGWSDTDFIKESCLSFYLALRICADYLVALLITEIEYSFEKDYGAFASITSF